ncbi:cyclin-like protein [Paraphysoderma sedebokerense]|nr:cyclin-like protein [Paraphysoderma sedebokerense]
MDNSAYELQQPADTSVSAAYHLPTAKQRADLNLTLMCRNCRDEVPNIVEDFKQGDLVCGNCGLVLGDRIIDTRSEWRTFANDEGGDDPSRVGAAADPLLGQRLGLETVIGAMDGGKGSARDLSKVHARTSAARGERNILQAFKDIQNLAERISLPRSVADVAKQMYKQVDDEKLLKGKNQDAIIAVCIVIACRQAGVPRTFKEITHLTKVPKKEIGRVYKLLSAHLNTAIKGMDSADLMSRYCSNLGLPLEVQRASASVASKAKDLIGLSGRSPISIAGACIYMVSHLYGSPKSAKEIAPVVGVSDGTIKQAYKVLYSNRDTLLTDEMKKIGRLEFLPSA